MALKFVCSSCGETIYLKHLSVGELALCKKCQSGTIIPKDAVLIDESEIPYENPIQNSPDIMPDDDIGFEKWEKWIRRVIGSILVGGGFLGFMGILQFIQINELGLYLIIFTVVFCCLFVWNVFLGVGLIENNQRCLRWAKVIMALQIPIISSSIFTYKYIAGLMLGILTSDRGLLHFDFGLSGTLQFWLYNPQAVFEIGLNLYAIFALILLFTIRHKKQPEVLTENIPTKSNMPDQELGN